MIRQVIMKGRPGSGSLSSLFRQMHLTTVNDVAYGSSELAGRPACPSSPLGISVAQIMSKEQINKNDQLFSPHPLTLFNGGNQHGIKLPMNTQARQGILENPMLNIIQPSIGIPPDMIKRSGIQTPVTSVKKIPLETPTNHGNRTKEIIDDPNASSIIEKQAARLVVIRRIKMNKHKLRKLRKKMKYTWAKIRLRRAIRREKAYLNSKMELINAAKNFDAKEYVAGIIKRAKEEPIPRKWTDPLMPEWYKEQEMKKEEDNARYQKMINLYLNKSITIDFRDKKK